MLRSALYRLSSGHQQRLSLDSVPRDGIPQTLMENRRSRYHRDTKQVQRDRNSLGRP